MGDWDADASERIYKFIFTSVSESMGRMFVENMAGVREEDFSKEAPRDSVLKLVSALNNWLGPQVMQGIILNIENEFRDQNCQRVLAELKSTMN